MSNKSLFSKLLKKYRGRAGWNQSELARQLEKCGCPLDVSTINKYELGERRPHGGFISCLEACLKLKDKEAIALCEALATDYLESLVDEYLSWRKK